MLVDIVGYNKREYEKNGEHKSFYSFYALEKHASSRITAGRRCFEVLASVKYADEKILPAFSSGSDIHVGWEKDGSRRPFLYVK